MNTQTFSQVSTKMGRCHTFQVYTQQIRWVRLVLETCMQKSGSKSRQGILSDCRHLLTVKAFVEARLIDLIEKDDLLKRLSTVGHMRIET